MSDGVTNQVLSIAFWESRKTALFQLVRMADGTVITMRKVSHSDGTPVVDINIRKSTHTCGVKDQKIHFVLEGKK